MQTRRYESLTGETTLIPVFDVVFNERSGESCRVIVAIYSGTTSERSESSTSVFAR